MNREEHKTNQKPKNQFCGKINKIARPLAQMKKERSQINRVRNEKGSITTGCPHARE